MPIFPILTGPCWVCPQSPSEGSLFPAPTTDQGSSNGGREVSPGGVGVSGTPSSAVHPSPRHPGSSRLLCLGGGTLVIFQVLHRGLSVQTPVFSSFFHLFPQFLLLPSPPPPSTSVSPRSFFFAEGSCSSSEPSFSLLRAVLEPWLTEGGTDRKAPPLGHQHLRQSCNPLPSQPPAIPRHQAPDKGPSLVAFGGRQQML